MPEQFARNSRSWVLIAGLLFMGQTGCQARVAERLRVSKAPTASLLGEVRLAPHARLPAYTAIDLARRPLQLHEQPQPPSECDAANRRSRTPVQRADSGGLNGIAVAASDFTHTPHHKPREHRVVIEHCQLKPALVAATSGDTLTVENRDSYAFEPLVGPSYYATALPSHERLKLPLEPGIDAIQCSPGAPCGRTDLLVFMHPVHAVTDAIGKFHIDALPAQELVRITAWHPLFEPSETFIWLEPGAQGHIVLELQPKARFVPPP
jgi:hypothetical protein